MIDIGRPGVLFQARATTSQTLANTTQAWPVAMTTEDVDDADAHSTATNTARFTAPRAGLYRFSAALVWTTGQATTAGTLLRQARVLKNNTTDIGSSTSTYAGGYLSTIIPPTFVTLAATDYIELLAITGLANSTLYGTTTTGSMLLVELVR